MLAMTVRPQHHVGVEFFPPEIEESIAEALLLRSVLHTGHLKRQRLGGRQHLDAVHDDFDEAGRQRGIDVLVGARDHAAGDGNHAFELQRLRGPEGRRFRGEHALGDAVVIAEIDEQQLPVIAFAIRPAGEAHDLTDMLGTKNGTVVSSISL